eukprot:Gb_29495 [translate_table: standard]
MGPPRPCYDCEHPQIKSSACDHHLIPGQKIIRLSCKMAGSLRAPVIWSTAIDLQTTGFGHTSHPCYYELGLSGPCDSSLNTYTLKCFRVGFFAQRRMMHRRENPVRGTGKEIQCFRHASSACPDRLEGIRDLFVDGMIVVMQEIYLCPCLPRRQATPVPIAANKLCEGRPERTPDLDAEVAVRRSGNGNYVFEVNSTGVTQEMLQGIRSTIRLQSTSEAMRDSRSHFVITVQSSQYINPGEELHLAVQKAWDVLKGKSNLGYRDLCSVASLIGRACRANQLTKLNPIFPLPRGQEYYPNLSRFDPWPMKQQRELQLMPSKQPADNSEAVPVSVMTADMSSELIGIRPTRPGPALSERRFNAREPSDNDDDGLELSIGLYQNRTVDIAGQGKAGEETFDRQSGADASCADVGKAEQVLGMSNECSVERTKKQAQQERQEAESEVAGAEAVKQQAREELRIASAEKAYAEHARELTKRQMELAEAELASAKRIREQAQAELSRAELLREHATRRIDATCLEITCQSCRRLFHCRFPTLDTANCNKASETTFNVSRQIMTRPPSGIHSNNESDDSIYPQIIGSRVVITSAMSTAPISVLVDSNHNHDQTLPLNQTMSASVNSETTSTTKP